MLCLIKSIGMFLSIAVLIFNCQSAAFGESKSESMVCNLHDITDLMPGLAKLHGVKIGDGLQRSLDVYHQALIDGEISQQAYYYCIARIYHDIGNDEESLKSINQFIDIDKENFEAFFLRGLIHYLLDRCEEAIADFYRAEKFGLNGYNLSYSRAKAKIECGDFQGAIDDLEDAARPIPTTAYPVPLLLAFAEASRGASDLESAYNYSNAAVRTYEDLQLCHPSSTFCSFPDLIAAVNSLTETLCEMFKVEEALNIYSNYEHYSFPSPDIPKCTEN